MNRFDYSQIPEPCMAALKRYVNQKEAPGGFLRAVLEGDLNRACTYADGTNLWLLPVYSAWLYNEAPNLCHGSPERVRAWIGQPGITRDTRDKLINFLEDQRKIICKDTTPGAEYSRNLIDHLIRVADEAWRSSS